MRVSLSYWLIIVKVNELEKSLLVSVNVLRLFVNTLTADDKYSLISKDNSIQTIQKHLFQKRNILSEFFSAFFESALNFEHFQTKMILIAYVFAKLPTPKNALDKCLKAPVWDAYSTDDMGKWRTHWFNLNESVFIILIDHCEFNWVGKVTLSLMKCLKTFC